MLPFVFICKELSENVCTHIVCGADVHSEVLVLKAFGKPRDTYPVSFPNVTHRGILTCAHNLGARLIVLEKFA